MTHPTGIQPPPGGLALERFRSLAGSQTEGSFSLVSGQLQVAKRKFSGMTLVAGQGPGRQQALDLFKERLKEHYGSELADITLSRMELDNTHKLKAVKVRSLDYHLGQAREQLESRYLKPSEFDSSVARLESSVRLKTWVNELKAVKNSQRQRELVQQGITDVYNHYESKLGSADAPASRDTVLKEPRWQEFSQFVAKNFGMTVVRPDFTAEEMGVRAQEASLMHAQVTQLKDVVRDEARNWVHNGRTGSVQLLMASAMLDTMNGLWQEHLGMDNADWNVKDSRSGTGHSSQWKATSKTHEQTVSQSGSKMDVASQRGVSLNTEHVKGPVKPIVNAEAQGKAGIEINGT